MQLFKYLTIEILEKVLAGSIRFTQPGAFNDPFEMLPELYVPESYGEDNINFRFSVLDPRREPPIGELDVDFESDYCSDIHSRKILKELNQTIGILCLTKNPDSLLMWAHYANNYSGAIIEFDGEHEFFQGSFDIDYRKNRPKKDISCYLTEGSAIPIAELCVKSEDWVYEEEVRVVRSLSDCKKVKEHEKFPTYVMDIPLDAIKGIILGERTPVNEQRNIWNLVKETNISLSLAAIANWGYKFRNEPIKFNVPASMMNPSISPRTAHIFLDEIGPLAEMATWAIEDHPHSKIANDTV
jgi:hypothetical protein